MTHRYLVNLHEIDGILTPLLSPLGIMEGSYPDNQYPADFVLAGTVNRPWFTTNTLDIGVTRVLMAHSYNTGCGLTQ